MSFPNRRSVRLLVQWPLRHPDRSLALLAFACAFVVYLRTLCPTLYWGDCGELISSAVTLGVAHPTGYPVWCLLGKLWTVLLPAGSAAWKLGTMSAFFGALAAACLYAFGRYIGWPRAVALTVAGLFAFSRTFWQQCLFAETYSLTAFYTCLLLCLAARGRARGHKRVDLNLLALAYGFAMTNHQTNTLFLPGFLLYVLWSAPELRRLSNPAARLQWKQALACWLAPLAFYLYLPLRAMANPAANWGDPVTPFAFFYHVTGRLYAALMFHSSASDIVHRLAHRAAHLGDEFGAPVILLAALGLAVVWGRDRDRPLAALLTWILAADIAYAANYAIYNAYIYYIPAYLVLACLMGAALDKLWTAAMHAATPTRRPGFAMAGTAAALALVAVQLQSHMRVNNLSRCWIVYDYGRNLLASVPPNGILIDNGEYDSSNAAIEYLQVVEGCRRDVLPIKRGLLNDLYDPHYRRWANLWYLRQLVRNHPNAAGLFPSGPIGIRDAAAEMPLGMVIGRSLNQGRAVCVLDGDTKTARDTAAGVGSLATGLGRRYDVAPWGLLTRLYPKGDSPGSAYLQAQNDAVWTKYSLRGIYDGLYANDDFLTPIALDYYDGLNARANQALSLGRYADAAASYRGMLQLFQSDRAAAGLAFCQQAGSRVNRPPRT